MPREVTLAERGQFLLDYVDLLLRRARCNEAEDSATSRPGQPPRRTVRRAVTSAG